MRPATAAPGLVLGEGVRSASDVEFGAHVVVHAGTVIGDGCVIEDGAVLGKRPRLGPRSSASRAPPPPLVLGAARGLRGRRGVRRRAIGDGAIVGDQAHVRERA